jgi:hypothetical protein
LTHHLHRDPIGAVLNYWDYRGLTPFSKVLVKIGIERHGREASGTCRRPPIYRRRRPYAKRLSPHPSTRPARCCSLFFGTTDAWCLLLRYSSRLGSSDTVVRRAERVEVRHFIEGAARTAERLAHHLQRAPLGAVRHFWDYRGLIHPSKELAKIGIERHGRKVSGSGGGSPFHRGRRQDRRALCSQSLVAGRFRRIAGELPRVSVLYQHDKERSVSSSCCC